MTDERQSTRRNVLRTLILGATAAVVIAPTASEAETDVIDGGTP